MTLRGAELLRRQRGAVMVNADDVRKQSVRQLQKLAADTNPTTLEKVTKT